jgi:CheY-like chemotaxis protein
VEDNPANQLVLIKMLCQMNLSADVANDGKEAFERWKKESYQLILTDLQMPEMDGIEMTQAIREREKDLAGSPSYIVGVTANVLPEHRKKCMEAGMNDFLLKPIRMADLKGALDRYLEHRHAAK